MNNRVVHFEIPSDQPEQSMAFFANVFGWTFQQFGDEPYWIALTGSADTPGINGAIMKKNHPDQPLANAIQVDDLDAYVARIEQAGGTVVVPKMAVPTVGWLAYFKDPDGNIHGLWQPEVTAQ